MSGEGRWGGEGYVWMDDGFWHLQAMGHGDGRILMLMVMLGGGAFYEYHGRFEGILPHGEGRNTGAGLVTGGLGDL